MTPFLNTVCATVERYRMLKPGDRVLVGVSGGPDSMALLTALVALCPRYRVKLRAAYVNHGLRPLEAQREAALVKKVAGQWKVPMDLIRAPVDKRGGESLEAAAREVRYRHLIRTARRHRCNVIALGHTQDDQAETVLMWVIRGTGTGGLGGIPPVRRLDAANKLRLIRPLICSSRDQGLRFLKAHRIPTRTDRSNRMRRFLRNRIRRELIPLLERQYNPRIREHLGRLAQILQEDLALLELEFKQAFSRWARVGKGRVRLERLSLRALPEALRQGVLRLAVMKLKGDCQGFGALHWKAIDELILDGKGALDLPHHFRAEVIDEKNLVLRGNRV